MIRFQIYGVKGTPAHHEFNIAFFFKTTKHQQPRTSVQQSFGLHTFLYHVCTDDSTDMKRPPKYSCAWMVFQLGRKWLDSEDFFPGVCFFYAVVRKTIKKHLAYRCIVAYRCIFEWLLRRFYPDNSSYIFSLEKLHGKKFMRKTLTVLIFLGIPGEISLEKFLGKF